MLGVNMDVIGGRDIYIEFIPDSYTAMWTYNS